MNAPKQSDSSVNKLISELINIIPPDLKNLIGFMVGMYLLIGLPVAIMNGLTYASTYFRTQHSTAACWKIEQIGGRTIKLNTCTGESVDLPPAKPAS